MYREANACFDVCLQVPHCEGRSGYVQVRGKSSDAEPRRPFVVMTSEETEDQVTYSVLMPYVSAKAFFVTCGSSLDPIRRLQVLSDTLEALCLKQSAQDAANAAVL